MFISRYAVFLAALSWFAGAAILFPNNVSAAAPPNPQSSKSFLGTRYTTDVFAAARGLVLQARDYDKYIASSVVGDDRNLSRKIMSMMPSSQRGDFVYVSLSGRLVSNNPELLKYQKLTITSRQSSMKMLARRGFSEVRRSILQKEHAVQPNTYPCSPPDPGTGGAYVRQVSQCSFGTGTAFVTIQCFTTFFPGAPFSPDQGNLYMEITGANGTLFEGGLQYNNDQSIQPYAVESDRGNLTTQLNNYAVKYTCQNPNIGIFSGITFDGTMTYTEVGILPSQYTPQYVYLSDQQFTLQNASWQFFQAPLDFHEYQGVDHAGYFNPCSNCSISRVTAIAQSQWQGQVGYSIDGSYFGFDQINNKAAINWVQVAFGEWDSDCVPNTTLCNFLDSTDPLSYYGEAEPYPDTNISQSHLSGLPGYGPYEAYDAINLTGSTVNLQPGAPFSEPLGPIPCSIDGYNYCDAQSAIQKWYRECVLTHPPVDKMVAYQVETWYQTWSGTHRILSIASNTKTYTINNVCQPILRTSTWAPVEPKVQYNDPNLP